MSKRKREKLLQVMLSAEEHSRLRELADDKGLTTSDIVRLNILESWAKRENDRKVGE